VRYDALAVLLTAVPGTVGEAPLDAALEALEAALRDKDSVTIGAALTLGAHAADAVLAGEQATGQPPAAPSVAAVVAAVLHSGQWTLLEAGGHQAFLARGLSAGPAFTHGSVSPPLGAENCSPRVTTFRAHPGDVVFVACPDTVAALDVVQTAAAIRLAPSVAAGCQEIADWVSASRPGPHGFAAVRIAEPAPRVGVSLGATLASGMLMLCAAVLALLAMTGSPSKPQVPQAARDTTLVQPVPMAPHPGLSEVAPGGTESHPAGRTPDVPTLIGPESAAARTPPPVAPSTKGQVKIVGPPGTYAELREAKPGGTVHKGDVRTGQDSFVFYNLPIPAQYTLTVWPSKNRQTPLLKGKTINLDSLPVKFDTRERSVR
jgi:hypothetical protein